MKTHNLWFSMITPYSQISKKRLSKASSPFPHPVIGGTLLKRTKTDLSSYG